MAPGRQVHGGPGDCGPNATELVGCCAWNVNCSLQRRHRVPGQAAYPPFASKAQEEDKHGRDTLWELRAREVPEPIKPNWPGSSLIIEMLTTTTRATAPPPGVMGRSHEGASLGATPATAPVLLCAHS